MPTKTTFVVDSRALLRAVKSMRKNIEVVSVWHGVAWLSQDGPRLKLEALGARDEYLTAWVHGTVDDGPDVVGVDMSTLSGILKFCPEQIRTDIADNTLRISHNMPDSEGVAIVGGHNLRWRPDAIAPDSFCPVPDFGRIVAAMAQVLPSVHHDDNMDHIHCVHFAVRDGHMAIEALNGHLFQRKTRVLNMDAVVPLDGLLLPMEHALRLVRLWGCGFFGRGLKVAIKKGGKQRLSRLFVRGDAGEWSVPFREYEKPYPDTDVFLRRRKDATCLIKVRAGNFLTALHGMKSLTSARNSVDVQIGDHDLFLSVNDTHDNQGWRQIRMVGFAGDCPIPLQFPTEQLADLVTRVSRPSDVLCLFCTVSNGPAFVHTERDPDLISVIMPMRVDDGHEPAFSISEMSIEPEAV